MAGFTPSPLKEFADAEERKCPTCGRQRSIVRGTLRHAPHGIRSERIVFGDRCDFCGTISYTYLADDVADFVVEFPFD